MNHKGTGGKKGRSGRRPMSIEMKRHAVIDKYWDVANDFVDSKEVTLKEKMEQGVKIITKDIPDQVKHSGGITLNYGHRTKATDADAR